jgi:hypothetical protein
LYPCIYFDLAFIHGQNVISEAMYIEVVPNRSSPPAVLLRESFREGGKVRKRTVGNLSALPAHQIEGIRAVLKDQPLVAPDSLFEKVRDQQDGAVRAVRTAMGRLGVSGARRGVMARRSGRAHVGVRGRRRFSSTRAALSRAAEAR